MFSIIALIFTIWLPKVQQYWAKLLPLSARVRLQESRKKIFERILWHLTLFLKGRHNSSKLVRRRNWFQISLFCVFFRRWKKRSQDFKKHCRLIPRGFRILMMSGPESRQSGSGKRSVSQSATLVVISRSNQNVLQDRECGSGQSVQRMFGLWPLSPQLFPICQSPLQTVFGDFKTSRLTCVLEEKAVKIHEAFAAYATQNFVKLRFPT